MFFFCWFHRGHNSSFLSDRGNSNIHLLGNKCLSRDGSHQQIYDITNERLFSLETIFVSLDELSKHLLDDIWHNDEMWRLYECRLCDRLQWPQNDFCIIKMIEFLELECLPWATQRLQLNT